MSTLSSERRIRASRANGALSRGPKTPEGKRRSSRNALRHGLLSTRTDPDPQSVADYTQLLADFTARLAPRNEAEVRLVERMVATLIRRRHAWALEADLGDPVGADFPRYALLQRYESRLARVFYGALGQLGKFSKTRLYQTNLEPSLFATDSPENEPNTNPTPTQD